MRFSLICLSALAALGSPMMTGPSLAHPDHDEDEAPDMSPEEAGRAGIIRLISQAKLPVSWTKATLVSNKLRRVKGLRQTVLTFRNPAEGNAAKQSLFVLLDDHGQFLSADHALK